MGSLHRILSVAVLAALATCSTASADGGEVTVRTTEGGVPHIEAPDWRSLGFGYAWSVAHDNVCTLANVYVSVDAERARFFGPAARDTAGGNGLAHNNLQSDFFYKKIIDQGTVEDLVARPAPNGPSDELRELARGYTAGYNAALRDMDAPAGISDPACKDAPWVRPIEEITVWRRFYQLALLASSGVALDGIVSAQPAVDPLAALRSRDSALAGDTLRERLSDTLGGLGSNAVAFGKAATADGRGLLLGNPHFPWQGSERFYEAHLTIPGELDVAGASLLGVPLVLIGYTEGLAWSHTVSTARRFVPYELRLVPDDPYRYYVDGQPRRMRKTTVTVQSRQPDGALRPVSRDLYDTEHGPVLTSILGLPVFPWTPERAYALYDANSQFRLLNHFFEVNQAQSVGELDDIERRLQGIPWVNTVAADKTGRAYYADIGSVPNVDEEKRLTCSTPLGVALDQAARLLVLDGGRSSCAPGAAPGAAAPGILPPHRMPSLFRDDYVTNSNDSYWLTHPQQRLEGFPRIIGDERTARSTRTRIGLLMAAERKDWTPALMRDMVFNNRQHNGELWRDDLVTMCRADGEVPAAACDALARWDLKDDLGSEGAVLFRRFATRANGVTGGPWAVPFDERDPVGTPRGLNTAHPQVRQALRDAVAELRAAEVPFDQALGDSQSVTRLGERIPIHGGPGGLGVFNAISASWNGRAYAGVGHGTSYAQVVRPTGRCADASTILTYSQSSDPTSPHFADQTRMYSRKQWKQVPFCPEDVRRAAIRTEVLAPGSLRLSRARP